MEFKKKKSRIISQVAGRKYSGKVLDTNTGCPLGSVVNIIMRLFIYGYIFLIVLCGVQNGETAIFTQGDHLAGWNLS